MEGLEKITRDSYSKMQPSEETILYLKEIGGTDIDERNWSFSYLRQQLILKNSQELFRRYQVRVQHALFMELLFFNFLYNAGALSAFIFLPEEESRLVIFGKVSRSVGVVVHLVIFIAAYKESLFRSGKASMGVACLILLCMMTTEQGTSFFRLVTGHCNPSIRVTYYIVLTTSVLLPFSRKVYCATANFVVITVDLFLSGFSCRTTEENKLVLITADAVFLLVTAAVGLYIRYLIEVMSRRAFLDRRQCIESKMKIETEKNQEEKFLLTVLPQHIVREVRMDIREVIKNMNHIRISHKPFNKLYVEKHKDVSILYADIVNSMLLAASLKVADLVDTLNDLFGKFDDSAEKNKCMRIKLLGDCYYCVSGVPDKDPNHADNCVATGLDMIEIIRSVREKRKVDVDMRIGVHTGNILCGLLGLRKWQFDIWSRDVTVASHMEQAGVPGHVHITKSTKDQLRNTYNIRPVCPDRRDAYLQQEGIETYLISPRIDDVGKRVSESPEDTIRPETPRFRRNSFSYSQPKGHSRIGMRISSGMELLPRKRRTALDYSLHQYSKLVSEVNKIMETAIDRMALSKKDQWFSNEGIQPLLLTFRKFRHEKPYLQQPDPLFKYYLLCMLLIFCGITVIHLLIMSETLAFWVTYGVTLLVIIGACVPTWAGYLWMILKENDDIEILSSTILRISRKVWQTLAIRTAIWLVISTMLLFCSMLGLNECLDKSMFSVISSVQKLNDSSTTPPFSEVNREVDDDMNCSYPWFYTLCAALALTTTSVFLRIHYFLKLLLNATSLAGFWYVIDIQGEKVFQQETATLSDWEEFGRPVDQSHCFYLALVVIILHILDRQVEYVCRLDYLYKLRLKDEQEEARTMELVNRMLLHNILPHHVTNFYLNRRESQLEEAYHEEYTSIAVMFASIPNFANFYYEDNENEEGLRCIQLLNEIICDFDELLLKGVYSKVEKIKTIGSTYMVACGLHYWASQGKGLPWKEEDPLGNVMTLVDFASAMMATLQQLNKDAMQEFQLRIGISVGPVMAGVIGTVRPQYDIWGDTVNVASRMDTTGISGRIQVIKEVAELVEADGTYKCECRGDIFVKGKGNLTTYLLNTPYDEPYYEISRL